MYIRGVGADRSVYYINTHAVEYARLTVDDQMKEGLWEVVMKCKATLRVKLEAREVDKLALTKAGEY